MQNKLITMVFLQILALLCLSSKAGDYQDAQGNVYFYPKNCGIGQNAVVDGGLMADEVKINNWTLKQASQPPDYVFAPTYQLLPLKAVKDSIECNSHLPGVPSAGEIQDSGLGLADFSMTLLKKVEELTLYTIQGERKIQERQKQIEEWKKEIEEMGKNVAEGHSGKGAKGKEEGIKQ